MAESGTQSSIPSTALAEQTHHALSQAEEAWFPGLAAGLVAEFERSTHKDGWTAENYGTRRWLARNPAAARDIAATIQVGRQVVMVEALPHIRRFDGLHIAREVSRETASQLRAAVRLIGSAGTLAETVGTLVRSAHVLGAARGYDVSHSTPELPLSIFISVPNVDEPDAVPRLAEAIIHEAMHLQLTLIESVVPLISNEAQTNFSPWKQERRPVQGLLHGLYVFCVISQALRAVAQTVPEIAPYATRRRAEIADDVKQLGDGRAGLTRVGVELWNRLENEATDGR